MAHNSGPFVRRINSPSAHPLSTSPRPTSLSRPHWPWTPHTHTHSSSSISLPSATASPGPAHMNWEAGSSTSTNAYASHARQSAGSVQSSVSHVQAEETIRQWNFTAFEWTVRNVHALRDFVEQGQIIDRAEGPEEPHEVLRESPMLGDGKFKLEIVRTSSNEPELANVTPTLSASPLTQGQDSPQLVQAKPNLSLCVTSLMLDLAQGPEYDVTMMAAVKVQDDRCGERGARADWIWECWEKDWSFRQDSEVWECILPSLSSLLENARIAETDSFVICIQIHSPVGPQFPQHPSAYYVPRDLLDGVEASLDNPHTGDVKFVCLERSPQSPVLASPLIPPSPHSRRSSSETSAHSSTTARKRVIYAHSDILLRRSEYFQTMLTSSFSENVNVLPGERKIYEIVVEEADFVTIYWLLKYCYANWVLFKERDDPRASVDRMGEGWSARWLSNHTGGEWDWKTFSKAGFYEDASVGSKEDDGNDRSVHSAGSSVAARPPSSVGQGKRPAGGPGVSISSSPGPSSSRVPSRLTTSAAETRSAQGVSSSSKSSPSATRQSSVTSSRRVPPVPGPAYTYPVSPRQTRQHPTLQQQHNTIDPHPHPTPPPLPASALSIWLTAHRYAMPGLSSLALTHMMNTIQPSTAFSLLLATSRWEELHSLVEDYIVDQWDLACNSEEFEQCCQEVAAGEWGPEGGRTLAALFRRLRSR